MGGTGGRSGKFSVTRVCQRNAGILPGCFCAGLLVAPGTIIARQARGLLYVWAAPGLLARDDGNDDAGGQREDGHKTLRAKRARRFGRRFDLPIAAAQAGHRHGARNQSGQSHCCRYGYHNFLTQL